MAGGMPLAFMQEDLLSDSESETAKWSFRCMQRNSFLHDHYNFDYTARRFCPNKLFVYCMSDFLLYLYRSILAQLTYSKTELLNISKYIIRKSFSQLQHRNNISVRGSSSGTESVVRTFIDVYVSHHCR